jgi:hypothetical protein
MTDKEKYTVFIAQLNKRGHSFEWGALNFTTKSRLSFDFCFRLFDAFNNKPDGSSGLYKKPAPNFALPLCLIFFRTLFFSLLAKILFRRRRFQDKDYLLIKTLVNASGFTLDYRFQDAYFHKLVDYLKKKGTPIIVDATVFRPYLGNLRKIKRCVDGVPIVPRELYLSIADIYRCFLISLKRYLFSFELGDSVNFAGRDLGSIVRAEIRKECGGSSFFLNLLEYYSIRSFARRVRFSRALYPFEHRSWEGMFIAGLRKEKPQVRIIGYQHTSIAPKHTNFLLGKDEARDIALPDKIICMGEAARRIMEEIGNFPAGLLKTGCALRQNIMRPQDYRRSDVGDISNILVALTTDTQEYFKVLRFLDRALRADNTYNIRVRPHPITEIERGRWLPPGLSFKFEIDRDKDLNNSLSWAHLVIYASSTVSVEAIERGIPVLCLDLGEKLYPDPLFQLRDFKWQVCRPEELIGVIRGIKAMPQDEFGAAKERAAKYAAEYIYPATEERLANFL